MGSDTEGVIDTQETSIDKGSEFIPESVELLYHYFQKIDIRRAQLYMNHHVS